MATHLQSENPLGHIALGVALSQLNEDDAAIDEFKIALNRDPKSVPALDGLAKALIAQKRYLAAIAYLKDAPPVAVLQDDLAIAYSKNGNVIEAVQVLTNIVKQDPSSGEAHSNLAIAYTQQNQFRQAAEEFKEAHRLAPNDDAIRLSYVQALVVLAEFNTALPLISDYYKRKPRDFQALYLMGVVNRGLGNYAEAETMLGQALALNGNSYDVRYNLGFTLAKLGKKQEARQQLEKACNSGLHPARPAFNWRRYCEAWGRKSKHDKN
jgi:tetratricopeptide (TPR) repeat protein